jgi:hypothetical protein
LRLCGAKSEIEVGIANYGVFNPKSEIQNPQLEWGRGFDYPKDRKDYRGTDSFVGLLHSDDDLDFGAADSLRMDGFLRV